MVAGEPMRLMMGEKIAIRWRDDILFIGVFRGLSSGGFLARVEVAETIERQRREYFRWTVPLPLRFAVVSVVYRPWQRARTHDISAGGLCVPWKEAIDEGSEIELELTLDHEPVRALARVVRVQPSSEPPHPFRIALELIRIADADRSRIVRFIFRKQWSARSR